MKSSIFNGGTNLSLHLLLQAGVCGTYDGLQEVPDSTQSDQCSDQTKLLLQNDISLKNYLQQLSKATNIFILSLNSSHL